MEELKSPLLCPNTVTVRRNPHRKARATPSSAVPLPLPLSSQSVPDDIPSFPHQDILSIELPSSASQNSKKLVSENLRVFLRIRPLNVTKSTVKHGGGEEVKNVWPKNPKTKKVPNKKVKKISEICVAVKNSNSVTVSPPNSLQESKRVKSQMHEGFTHVFSGESSQSEVYEKMVHPLVEDFLKGKSGMLAALGPSGSGKTHTVFGCARDPGMVPLALRRIFAKDESNGDRLAWTFYLSMFEICSERGKCERLYDLLREGSELYLQQSTIKGLEEVIINDALQAESLIASGMLRRATAATNSNSQSSRSQCIINICCVPKKIDGESEDEPKRASLTIVDLAGAEREKKTGNQGLRMVESNFINNTSMVFGLCLRSLLEYQKNPRRPLQKHFQNSLLTRYLREYLEGKKRMALILTVKPGEEDYLETSNLLKQASPYTQIKFTSTEELGTSKCAKRPIQSLPRAEHQKKMKLSVVETYLIGETDTCGDQPQAQIEEIEKGINDNLKEIVVENKESLSCKVKDDLYIKEDPIELAIRDRQHQIMAKFAKALWDVLKQYKKKLEIAENELCCLRDDLTYEQKRSSDLENQVKDLKFKLSSVDVASTEAGISSVVASCSGTDSFQEQHYQKHENSCIPDCVAEIFRASKDLQPVDVYSDNGATISIDSHVNRCEEAVETVGSVGYFQVLKDSQEGDRASNARKFIGMESVGIDDTCAEIEGTDEMGNAAGRSESPVNTREVCSPLVEKEYAISDASISDSVLSCPLSPVLASGDDSSMVKIDQMQPVNTREVCSHLVEKESAISDAIISDSVLGSPLSPVSASGNDSSMVKIDQMPHKQSEKEQDSAVTVMPGDDAALTQESHCCTATDIAHSLPTCSSRDKQKPKRRLLPVSSNLLKDIGNLAVEDENDKPKGVKGGKGLAVETRNKSKGNTSLLRLLRNDLCR